jgi:hypothetical protein
MTGLLTTSIAQTCPIEAINAGTAPFDTFGSGRLDQT